MPLKAVSIDNRSSRKAKTLLSLLAGLAVVLVAVGDAGLFRLQADPSSVLAADKGRPAAGGAWDRVAPALKDQFVKDFEEAEDAQEVFARYLPVLGAPAILDHLERRESHCHSQAHDLGRALYAERGRLNDALAVCDHACTNGCMHGVMAEAAGHLRGAEAVHKLVAVCTGESHGPHHRPGNCAHAVGHGLLAQAGGGDEPNPADRSLPKALAGCRVFDSLPMRYYCATGVFMAYKDILDDLKADGRPPARASRHDPCDRFADVAPACYRYLLPHIAEALHLDRERMAEECLRLGGRLRLGCFHGLGMLGLDDVAREPAALETLCRAGGDDEQTVCIEGAIEKLADYNEQEAMAACRLLTGHAAAVCLEAAKGKMYRLAKPSMPLYVSGD